MDLNEMNDEQIEAEAKKSGYNPNYDGDDKRTPREYLEIAFSHNNILKKNNEKLSGEVDGLSKEIKNLHSKITNLVDFQENQKDKAVKKAITKLQAEKKDAITEGDHEKVEAIDKQIEEEGEKPASDKSKPKPSPVFDDWHDDNKWYDDKRIGAKADLLFDQYANTGRFTTDDAGHREILDIVTEEIKQLFPDTFTNPNKKKPAEVSGGGPSPDRSNNSNKSYADLPADAKAACDEFCVSIPGYTKEKYLEIYEWD